jgi:hypothetical protein
MFLYLTALMIYCVRKYEVDAFFRGLVNIDQPRMIHNQLPWPSWTVALAPDYSLFLPLSQRTSSIYQQAVPSINPENENQPAPAPAHTLNDYFNSAASQTMEVINSVTDSITTYIARYSNSRDDRGGNIEIPRGNNILNRGTGSTSSNASASNVNRYSRLDGTNEDENNNDVESHR